LATQTIWLAKPRTLLLQFDGRMASGVTAKDVALHWISALGADGARGFAIEYSGSAIRELSMEARLTLCNMSIEGGARCGLISPDQVTIESLRGRPSIPKGTDFDRASRHWLGLASTEVSCFDQRYVFQAADIQPTVTWGVSPEEALPILARLPDPIDAENPGKASQIADSLEYMGLTPGQKLTDIAIDKVFIGSCTNSRLSDLRDAAAILKGQKSKVPGFVSPGSKWVKSAAEAEGLHEIFLSAGLQWREPGCSMCVGMNGDFLLSGERCASTTNRNFKGRQGRGSRTHLMSPAMAAAAAVAGHLVDVRSFSEARL